MNTVVTEPRCGCWVSFCISDIENLIHRQPWQAEQLVVFDAALEQLYQLPPRKMVGITKTPWSWQDVEILREYVKKHKKRSLGL